ncbi:hypothetical protein NEFER03_0155 [Nematocida sp. LUAm3]|nr:hypothetical protein NEFER03_0155 [Nematocida sp. LUAm3]KAI5173608.1 hypothetical protein NEFER02_0124 [Nematocida sp. LUAm2]KAI5176829.1 hypothetical protein NEFER01_0154 [Nematocida sp. LUAm1]
MEEKQQEFTHFFIETAETVSVFYEAAVKELEQVSSRVFFLFSNAEKSLEMVTEAFSIHSFHWKYSKDGYQNAYDNILNTSKKQINKEESSCFFAIYKSLLEKESIPLVIDTHGISNARESIMLWKSKKLSELTSKKDICIEELSKYIYENINVAFHDFICKLLQSETDRKKIKDTQREIQKILLILDRQVGEVLGITKSTLSYNQRKIYILLLRCIEEEETKRRKNLYI